MRIEEFEFLKPISKGAYGSGDLYCKLYSYLFIITNFDSQSYLHSSTVWIQPSEQGSTDRQYLYDLKTLFSLYW